MPKLWEALLTLAILIAALAVGIIIFGVDPHVPMFVGVMAAAIMALHLGYKWDEVEKSMMDGIYKALQSICILIIVGILIGVWINAGVVPTMIYYGLKVLKPAIFFIACVLICSITSLATGTSWGTMGTMGVALMGKRYKVDRSKGLGENDPEMMWLTTMNPETRRLIKVMPEDAEATAHSFDLLLGDNLQGRKDHIAENGYKYLEMIDVS